MFVVATAGHVDHGKSTLVRALTGTDPDRLAEERRRGLTLDLGYAWCTLPTGEHVAFVDVPGHQRFIGTMLAGLGPAPVVMFVVAADEGWCRQSDEHLAAVDALGVQHGLLVVTRSDRADPDPAAHEALERLGASSLGVVEAVAVSGRTGAGMDELRTALSRTLATMPPPVVDAPVRFWIDRSFSVDGAGTVVTGTLGAGTITSGDVLTLRDRQLTVREIRSSGSTVTSVGPVSRVALNLRPVAAADIGRGDVLLSSDRFALTSELDVRLDARQRLPTDLVLHVGTAAVAVRVRPLGAGADPVTARLTLARALPVRAGDRAVLRDPGRQSVAAGVLVLDADPPALTRRGAARARAETLRTAVIPPDAVVEVARRGAVPRSHLDRLGIDTAELDDIGGWLVDPDRRSDWIARAPAVVAQWTQRYPLDPGMPETAFLQALDAPRALLPSLLAGTGLQAADGRVCPTGSPGGLGAVEQALSTLLERLDTAPFDAPQHDELHALGLGRRELAAAVRTGRLIQVADGVVLRPDAVGRATRVLRALDAPFTLSSARQALGTTRRVAVPLLEHLDALGVTQRISDVARRVVVDSQ